MSAFESIKRHATPDIQKENKLRFFFFDGGKMGIRG